MNDASVLTLLRLPARLDELGAAKLLGVQPHDIPVLMRAKLLKPLGSPAPNAPKYFASCDVEEKSHNLAWLDKATRILTLHWREKNARNKPANAA